jgi:tRNA(Ile)-lysidine synthase TilS/MesJ
MNKVRHVLGISGGKDSAALAIYMKQNYPQLDIVYILLLRVKSSTKPTN